MCGNRLLIVDDNRDFADFVARVAVGCGFEIRFATGEAAFKDAVAAWAPTAIALDLAMPGMDGLEALRHLEAMDSGARILIMSGHDRRVVEAAQRVGLERGLEIGGVLAKPIRAAHLRAKLEELLRPLEDTAMSELRQALRRGELFVLYQPKVAFASGAPTGVEALVRWHHPTRGPIAPDSFLPLAEQIGMMDALTGYVLECAIRQQAAWAAQGLDLEVAVNLSPVNLVREELADDIMVLCRKHAVRPERVTLEITETAAMSDALRALDLLTRLRLKGFGIAIDDFGTGFSSLARLQRLPVTEIKIDRSFVQESLTSRSAGAIVKTVVDLARNMEMTSVAEGVETTEHFRMLASLGCQLGQGYGIGRPLEAPALAEWMAGWSAAHPRSDAVT